MEAAVNKESGATVSFAYHVKRDPGALRWLSLTVRHSR